VKFQLIPHLLVCDANSSGPSRPGLASCLALALALALAMSLQPALAAPVAGKTGSDDLVIATGGKTTAVVVVSPDAGTNEKLAATDLVKYIEMLSGAKPALAETADAITTALQSTGPVILVGTAALAADASLQPMLEKSLKPNPTLRADGTLLVRKGNRLYVAGNHDEAHYYAAARLLQLWGCRWYLPTEFGECIPFEPILKIGQLNETYGSPFETRMYWIAWNGSNEGQADFMRRNYMNNVQVSGGHAIAKYMKALIPPGKTMFNVPIAENKTAKVVAAQLMEPFSQGKEIVLGLEDGIYESDSAIDKELQAGLTEKYFLTATLTDNFLVMYNKICANLLEAYPNSKSKIGFLAYSNITMPPQRDIKAAKPLVASLAPIDIDPIHDMDSPLSPQRQEYKGMLYRWAEVMEGRLFIYDYDQGMLVWPDLPNPSIQSIRHDIHHYLKAGVLGISTESRGAMATIFLNLHVRGQLMWNPETDVDALLDEFYTNFYGPAAKPMNAYWTAIFKAWNDTIVTEHEHFVAAAIYTPELVAELRGHLMEAEVELAAAPASVKDIQYAERMEFTRHSFDLIEAYIAMCHAGAAAADYAAAVAAGERALAARMELAKMNPTFTTRVVGVAAESEEGGAAWLAGQVKQYRGLLARTNGQQGTLVTKLPLAWAYHRDPHDTGLARGWAYSPVDLTYWETEGKKLTGWNRKDYPTTEWEMLDTNLYAQAQGILHPDGQSFTGFHWYRTEVDLTADQVAGKPHVLLPGVFNNAWIYVNGYLVAYRPQGKMWWMNDYAFEWDIDVAGKLKPGKNQLAVRLSNPHHFGGIFRRPVIYRAK
jgi:hypothetical protein